MKTRMLISVLNFLCFGHLLFSQAPDWADDNTRELLFPSTDYYSGFVSQEVNPKENDIFQVKEGAEKLAKIKLSASVYADLSGNSILKKTANSGRSSSGDYSEQIRSTFADEIQVRTNTRLEDIRVKETVYDRKNRKVYALAFLDKHQWADKLQKKIDDHIAGITSHVDQAKRYYQQSDQYSSFLQLASAKELSRQTEILQGDYIMVSGGNYAADLIRTLNGEIDKLYRRILNSTNLNIENACKIMVSELKEKSGGIKYPVTIKPLLYAGTNYSTPFSRNMFYDLGSAMQAVDWDDEINKMAHAEVDGIYIVQDSVVKVFLKMSFLNMPESDLKPPVSVTGYVSRSWLRKNSIEFIPPLAKNDEALRFEMQPTEPEGNDDFQVIAKPDKLEFCEGEKMQLYVRTAKPGYLRILYFDSENKTNILLDNYRITEDSTNLWIDLQKNGRLDLIFGGSTGQESMLVAFSAHPHPALSYTIEKINIGGKLYDTRIVDNPLLAVQKTKGVVNAADSDAQATTRNHTTPDPSYRQQGFSIRVFKK